MSKPVGFAFNKKYKKNGVDQEINIDLTRWLIPGGAAPNQKSFDKNMKDDDWNNVDESRIPLLQDVMKHLNNVLRKGRSKASVTTVVNVIRAFWSYCENQNIQLTTAQLSNEKAFELYDQHLYSKAWGKSGTSSNKNTAYGYMIRLTQFLDNVFGVPESKKHKFYSKCIKAYKQPRKTALSPTAEKQNLDDFRVFVKFISDTCKQLSIEKIKKGIPLEFEYTESGEQMIGRYPIQINSRYPNGKPRHQGTIHDIERFRIEAEFLLFALYTGMNPSQISELPLADFDWAKKGNEWHVTVYKPRAGENKSFHIPKEYRDRLKNYEAYVKEFYPDSQWLFPLPEEADRLRNIRNLVKAHDIPWFPAKALRTVKANFIYRLDPELEPELLQHKAETFKQYYHEPSLIKTSQEITQFWKGQSTNNLGGGCSLEPSATKDIPNKIVTPNCQEASGCLWCENYRDVESLDYVWSLLSYRELMFVERKWTLMDTDTKPDYVIERIAQRLNALKEVSERFSDWINEAESRVASRRFHPTWDSYLEAIS